MSDEASEDAEPLLRGRQSAGRGEERPSTQSRHVLLIGALVACVLWLLPPLDVLLCADPYAPEPPYCTYRLRVRASCVAYVTEAQGSCYATVCTRESMCTYRAPWHHRCCSPRHRAWRACSL